MLSLNPNRSPNQELMWKTKMRMPRGELQMIERRKRKSQLRGLHALEAGVVLEKQEDGVEGEQVRVPDDK
jgi:hypothetical protein